MQASIDREGRDGYTASGLCAHVGVSSTSTGSTGAIIVIEGNERVFGERRKLNVELVKP